MKKLFLVLILSVMLIAVASTSQATCYQYGKLQVVNFSPTSAIVYVGSFGAAQYYYTFTTTNANFMHILSGLLGKYVGITGSAASCPTTGVNRAGGVISLIYGWD